MLCLCPDPLSRLSTSCSLAWTAAISEGSSLRGKEGSEDREFITVAPSLPGHQGLAVSSTHSYPRAGGPAALSAGSPLLLALDPCNSPVSCPNPASTSVNKLLNSPCITQGEAVISLLPGP